MEKLAEGIREGMIFWAAGWLFILAYGLLGIAAKKLISAIALAQAGCHR